MTLREERLHLTAAMADMGIVVRRRKPKRMLKAGEKRLRACKDKWHTRYLATLERTGSRRSAAAAAGVSYGGSLNAIRANIALRAKVKLAEANHLIHTLRELARTRIRRNTLKIGQRKARALISLLDRA